MEKSIRLTGQWLGSFVYGPEYGDEIYGERVQFRFYIEEVGDGQFNGTSVDIVGYGANFDTAIITGFLKDDFISFTKEYPKYFIIDENGMALEDTSSLKPRLIYSGQFNSNTGFFIGQWEFWANEMLSGDGSIVDIFTGTWEMTRDNM
jgi:hypothetical protein